MFYRERRKLRLYEDLYGAERWSSHGRRSARAKLSRAHRESARGL